MVNEVNKLIYNSLLRYSALHLPEVGTLYIKRSVSTVSGRDIQAPTTNIEFSSNREARSLVDIIAAECSVDIGEAEEIYARWYNRVCDGSVVTIEGVGTLRNRSFIADNTLIDLLNRYNITGVNLLKKGSAIKVVSIVATILIIITIAIFIYIKLPIQTIPCATPALVTNSRVVTDEEPLVSDVEDVPIESEPMFSEEVADNVATVDESVVELEIAEKEVVTSAVEPEIGYMVVVGSFETMENAERYCTIVERKTSEVKCRIRTLGRLYAVVAFVAEDKNDCQEFITNHIKLFPQAWIHTPRKLR